MGSDKEREQPIQETPKVDDMTDEQLGEIIRESITNSELRVRGSIQMAEIPLEKEVIDGVVGLIIEVWRVEDIKPLVRLAMDADEEGSRTHELYTDIEYRNKVKARTEPREALDSLKSYVVEKLTPKRIPKLPPMLRSYPTTAINALVMMKQAEKPKPPSPYGKYL